MQLTFKYAAESKRKRFKGDMIRNLRNIHCEKREGGIICIIAEEGHLGPLGVIDERGNLDGRGKGCAHRLKATESTNEKKNPQPIGC